MSSEELTSWKEIASFLGKGVRTAQRWEAQLALPVHRPNARANGIVRASREELRRWMDTRWSQRSKRSGEGRGLSHQFRPVTTDVVEVSRRMRAQRERVLEEFRAARNRLITELQASVEVMSVNRGKTSLPKTC